MNFAHLVDYAMLAGFPMLFAGMALAFARLMRGPSMADRVVALDLIAILAVAVMGLLAIDDAAPVFIDVAITLALVAFLGTVAFARYVQTRRGREDTDTA